MVIIDTIISEIKLFNMAAKNFGIVYNEDLLQLKDTREIFLQKNSRLPKF